MEQLVQEFNDFLKTKGLRHSRPREVVAREFFRTSKHISVEELVRRVQEQSPKIGIATVYRTLTLLKESGLASRWEFAPRLVAYERKPDTHHDHLICSTCGKMVEFHSKELEELQEKISKGYGFALQFHRMELYGTCAQCQKKGR